MGFRVVSGVTALRSSFKFTGAVVAVLLFASITGCSSAGSETGERSSGAEETKSSSSIIEPIEFEGTGEFTSESFELPEGVARIEVTHDPVGDTLMRTHLVNASGPGEWFSVGGPRGQYEASYGGYVLAGDCMIRVDADPGASWTARVTVLSPESASANAATEWSGNTDFLSDFVRVPDSATSVVVDYSGSEDLSIGFWDEYGAPINGSVEKGSSFTGSIPLDQALLEYDGPIVMLVRADGPWSVALQ